MALSNDHVAIVDLTDGAALAIAGNAALVFTKAYKLRKGVKYSFEWQFASPGVVECDIFIDQANTDGTPKIPDLNYVAPEGSSALIASTGSKLVLIKEFVPASTAFLRGRIVGKGSNNAGTTLERFRIIATPINA